MMRALAFRLAVVMLGALAIAGAAGASRSDPDASVAALRKAAAKHPRDPDYSWAVAEALDAVGRPLQAAAQMRAHLKRWPEQPPGGWRALGRVEYRAGNFEAARDALSEALRRDPRDGEAELYLGLALHALGDPHAAERHLEAAAELDPSLAGDALLVAGISHLSRGEQERGRDLLERVIELAPDSPSAREARALGRARTQGRPPFEFEAYTGIGYDTNVSLEGGADLPGLGSANGDTFTEFGSRVAWRPALLGEQRPLELGATYERGDYVELDAYSIQRTGGNASWIYSPHEKLSLRLGGDGAFWLVDDDPYLLSGSVLPSLLVALPRRAGALRLHTTGQWSDYLDGSAYDSLERDGWSYGGGIDHVLLWRIAESERTGLVTWGGSYERRDTTGGTDEVLGSEFDSAYDRNRWRARISAKLPLPFEVEAKAQLALDTERYDNRDVADAAFSDTPARRRDFVVYTNVSLRRNLYRNLDLELLATFEDRDSNVAVHRYQHTVAGMRLLALFR
jgi:tetratricopeptide (TPR) repeat protein